MTCKAEYVDATDAHHEFSRCVRCGISWDRYSEPPQAACADAKIKWREESAVATPLTVENAEFVSAFRASNGATTDASAIWHPGASTSAVSGIFEWAPIPSKAKSELRVSKTGAVKASIGKRPLHLLPRDAIEAVADVMALGAAKYGDRNWERGLSISDLVRAADGHLWDWFLRRNDGRDPQFGTSHLAHAACCVLFLLAHELRGLPDDRPPAVPEVPRPTKEG